MKKLFIIFAILCLAAPAMAADWNFYGSARFATFWQDFDFDDNTLAYNDDADLQWAQQGNSRIGANVKFNDQIGGGFEMSDSFGKRKLFGTYTFGNGSQLLIGQTYTPSSTLFYSNSVFDGDGDLLGVGEFYVGRVPMIQWKMGGFKVALITPAEDGVGDVDLDVTLPKIEASYRFRSDTFFADVFAGYQTYEVELSPAGGVDRDVDSYVLGGGVGANFGAFFAKIGAHMGQNLGNYGAYNPVGLDLSQGVNATTGGELDNDALGYLAVLGFNASEMFTIEAGYGHAEGETDAQPGAADNTTEADQFYLNCTINIAPGFFIVPEVGMVKFSEDATNPEPELTYFGAKWQINF